MDKICILLLNYNLGKMTDSLVVELKPFLDNNIDLEVLDASTSKEKQSKYMTKKIEDNYYGENFRCAIHDILKEDPNKYDWFVLMSNDIYNLPQTNWIRGLVNSANAIDAKLITPFINEDGTSHKVMYKRNSLKGFRFVNWVDFQTPIIKADLIKRVIGKWTSILKYGWGIDSLFAIECYKNNYKIAISDSIGVCHYDKKTFKEAEDLLTLEQYRQRAMTAEEVFLSNLYGKEFFIKWRNNLRTIEEK